MQLFIPHLSNRAGLFVFASIHCPDVLWIVMHACICHTCLVEKSKTVILMNLKLDIQPWPHIQLINWVKFYMPSAQHWLYEVPMLRTWMGVHGPSS